MHRDEKEAMLDEVGAVLERLSAVLDSNDADGFCPTDIYTELAAWRYILLLSLRIAGANARLPEFPKDSFSASNFVCYELGDLVEEIVSSCLETNGFQYDVYELERWDKDLIGMGFGDCGRVEEFMQHIADGDVFGKDTLYMEDGFLDFVNDMEGCEYFSYLKVVIYKSRYLGQLMEQAKRMGFDHELCYIQMKMYLDLMVSDIPVYTAAEKGVRDGTYYFYFTLYDYDSEDYSDGNVTWHDMSKKLVWNAMKAIQYAKKLEELLGTSNMANGA